ncbi:MAG: rhamnogalacturonan acetylesterase, partial [Planctomycetaceae bacterium]
VELGADDVASVTTCKGESRRLFVLGARVPKGGRVVKTFLVDVHRAEFSGGRVTLKERERGTANWDDRITLEMLGDPPGVRSVSVEPLAPDAAITRIFLAGDSTVTDQAREPYAGWGQMLPSFFGPGAVVANHAESGLALASFRGGRRLDKILAQLRPGDFVLIQFGHNDQKAKGEAAGAFAGYATLLAEFVDRIRDREGRPVLVTSVARRRFDDTGTVVESLGDFPEAVRRVADDKDVPLVDLNAMSKRLYQALGVEGSKDVFLHVPAHTYPGQSEPIRDDTHFSAYGAYEIARCVVEGIRRDVPGLAPLLAADVEPFDPGHPDPPDSVSIPASPFEVLAVPDGR